jgi:error-prone DNA polymerase
MSYVELHCHSAYSFLDGASTPDELAARAADLGYPALALTDHDGVCGSLEFAQAAKGSGSSRSRAPSCHSPAVHTSPSSSDVEGYANLCRL